MRKIKSFVRREGRLTPGQEKGLTTQWPLYGLSLTDGALDIEKTFGRHAAPTVLEIGFGMGRSLAEMAANAPEKNFIGIEVHTPGVGSLLAAIEKNGLTNIRIYQDDAVHVLNECIPDNSLAIVQIFFPDPWPKKKHHKRRLIQVSFIELLKRKLQIGGKLHFATDWQNYAEQMVEVMNQVTGFENEAGDQVFSERPSYRPLTKFEERGHHLGHQTWELLFILCK